jgi:hypothetical protein
LAFHIQIDKDVVRRILGHHYRPGQPSGGPSWLTFLGHMKDPQKKGVLTQFWHIMKMRRNGFWNREKCFRMSVVLTVGV